MKNLQITDTALTTDMDNLPEWLHPEDVTLSLAKAPRHPRNKQEVELREMIYDSVFEYALDHIAAGTPVTSIIRDDPRNIDYARFLRWVRKNPKRLARYEEAQEIAAEILVDKMDHLLNPDAREDACAVTGMLDRSKFEFEVLKWKAGSFNKRKFGSNKHIEVSSPDMTDDAMKKMSTEELKQMVAEQLTIDNSSL